MARAKPKKKSAQGKATPARQRAARRLRRKRRRSRVLRFVLRWTLRAAFLLLLIIAALRWVNPPLNYYQAREWIRLGTFDRDWVALEDMSQHLPRSAAAAEDANFCLHYGIDVENLRLAWEGGARRGGSTISQQTAKNVFLWQDRSWVRKGLEAGFTGLIELIWGKRRIMEVYLNVAEFDEGVFGVGAAMPHYFGVSARDASPTQAARLMAILPDPKRRSASRPGKFTQSRTRQIVAGAGTIRADGRAGCFSGG